MTDFAYNGEFLLKDGSVTTRNLEEQWADKDFLNQIEIFTLVPKAPNNGWPIFRMHIPDKAKPVWVWRVFRKGLTNSGPAMRIYGIGYKKRGQKPHMMWIMPGGHVEAGTDNPILANLMWSIPREG